VALRLWGAYAGLSGKKKPILARFAALSRSAASDEAKTGFAPAVRIKSEGGRGKIAGRKASPRENGVSYIYVLVPGRGNRFSKGVFPMCRNIKTLYNFDPPVTPDEVRAASLQFVRKITGFNKPSQANELAFTRAVDEIANVSLNLLQSLETTARPKNREEEAAKAKARAAERFGA